MNFVKGVWMEISNWKRTVAVIVIVALSMLLILPYLLRLLRKVPGVGAVIDKAPGTIAAILLTFALVGGAHAQGTPIGAPFDSTSHVFKQISAPTIDPAPIVLAVVGGALLSGLAVFFLMAAKRGAWQLRPTALALIALLGAGAWCYAVPPNVAKSFTSIVIRPAGDAVEDTNGVARFYSLNASNYIMIGTNGAITAFTASGTLTGLSGRFWFSNNFFGGGYATQTFWNGLLVSTNGIAAPAVQ
jgi:hypothetical protein